MKRRIKIILRLFVLSIILIGSQSALAYESPGKPGGYVNDFAGVLSSDLISELNADLGAYEAQTGNEIAVVTVANLSGDYIENFAIELVEEWGIGKEDRDNGVLLLVAVEERQARIEVGYGLEGALPDVTANRIIQNELVPAFQVGDYDGGINASVSAIKQATKGEYTAVGNEKIAAENARLYYKLFVFLIFFGLPIFAAVFGPSKSWWQGGVVGAGAGVIVGLIQWSLVMGALSAISFGLVGLLLDYWVSKNHRPGGRGGPGGIFFGGGGFGGGSGGGFGGFGGGGFGGGGASGRW